jgi:hypothetical protein
VSRRFGSWLFLGELLLLVRAANRRGPKPITAASAAPASMPARPTPFPAPYRIDARRCISYLTIEHEGRSTRRCGRCSATASMAATTASRPVPVEQVRAIGARSRASCRARPRRAGAGELATLDDAAFPQRFAGTAIKRIGRDRFIRNVAYALGNSGAATSLPAVQQLLNDDLALVRDAARWALSRLTGGTHETRPDIPAGAGSGGRPGATDDAGAIKAIVASPDRTPADLTNDKRRHPEDILAFLAIKPGITALDLSAGGGYTTELLARSIGPTARSTARAGRARHPPPRPTNREGQLQSRRVSRRRRRRPPHGPPRGAGRPRRRMKAPTSPPRRSSPWCSRSRIPCRPNWPTASSTW